VASLSSQSSSPWSSSRSSPGELSALSQQQVKASLTGILLMLQVTRTED
jgi:hypothetical protein